MALRSGINLFPAEYGQPGWIEFDSMINVRPRLGDRSSFVENAAVREQIVEIVDRLVVALARFSMQASLRAGGVS